MKAIVELRAMAVSAAAAVTAALSAVAERTAPGGLTLAAPFSEGAVLQAGRSVPVWGAGAKPGETVTVRFGRFSAAAKADGKGAWRAALPPMEASRESGMLEVSCGGVTKNVGDVVVGEVWLCSGQSNMAQALVDPKLPRYRDGIGSMVAQTVRNPLLRHMAAPGKSGWHRFTPEYLSSGRRSAIAVHYALEIYSHLEVPVGVVEASAGGSNIDAWQPDGGPKASCNARYMEGLYPYAMRGVLWYQGETNIYLGEVEEYGRKMHLLYDRWRERLENPDLSFYYVQLAPFARGNNVVHKSEDGTTRVVDYDNRFPRFLCVQAAFEKEEPNAAMTVINDIGSISDIHPNEKWLVAKRLALHALKRNYGFTGVEDSSPTPRSAKADGSRVVVSFDHARSLYVYARGKSFSADLPPFELAGPDGAFKPARIENYRSRKWFESGAIDGNEIVLSATGVSEPSAVRYAWNKPWTGVVYNDVDLPLGTFSMKVDGALPRQGRNTEGE